MILTRFIYLLLVTFCFQACSMITANFTDSFKSVSNPIVALLPPVSSNDLARENLDLVFQSLRTELENHGYTVLDDSAVKSFCSASMCKNFKDLNNRYKANVFAQLTISSSYNTNLLAAYYNSLDGKLELFDLDGKNLGSIEHRESERGGILLGSGQIFQAISDSISNVVDSPIAKLAKRFAVKIASELPSPKYSEDFYTSDSLKINNIDIEPVSPGFAKLCVDGSPGNFAYLVANNIRTNLRTDGNGHYCGIFDGNVAPFFKETEYEIQLRDPAGQVVSKSFPSYSDRLCKLQPQAESYLKGGKKHIQIVCDSESNPSAIQNSKTCNLNLYPGCSSLEFVVYGSSEADGPYTKLARFNGLTWQGPNQSIAYLKILPLLAGERSLPLIDVRELEVTK